METTIPASKYGNILAVRENGKNGVHVKYCLFESSFRKDGMYVYSIQLETCSEYGTDIAAAYDISRNLHEAHELFSKLADALVTSCTLYDVLEELL